MAFKIEDPDPPKTWGQFIECIGHIMITLGVTDKSPSEIIRAARLAVVDTDPEVQKTRRASLRRLIRRRP